MAKKRKASGSGQQKSTLPDSRGSKLAISTYEDVADSEDEFHINRDKILLEEGPEAKRRRKMREQDEFLEASDEEIMGYSSASEGDEDEDEEQAEEESDDDDFGLKPSKDHDGSDVDESNWGASKKDYYNADAIETEQDALDEEAEALRIQKKQLEGMSEADFGFDESAWVGEGEAAEDQLMDGEVVTEVLPQLRITEDMTPEERHKLLRSRYPEFDHLAKEFLELQAVHEELGETAGASVNPMAIVKYQALAAYLAAIAMYFALLTSTSEENGLVGLAKSPLELRDHPVMEGLVKCRELWSKAKNIVITEESSDLSESEISEVEEPLDLVDIIDEVDSAPVHRKKKTKAQKAADAAYAAAQAQKAERLRLLEEDLATLPTIAGKPASVKIAKSALKASAPVPTNPDDSDLGDEELTAQELAEKAKRKKTLRFYTSQITQKANKRGNAGKDAGGDMDIPHRERLRDRQARLLAEAEKRGHSKKAEPRDQLGDDSDEEDRRQARQLRGEEGVDDDEYYDMVAARSKDRKSDKKAKAEAFAQAAREAGQVVEREEIGADGKRRITYAIEKNKGLTPKRKKDVRNPRVKKRKKFEEKKKKLKSVRAVYQGGEGRGGYKGELTGIKKGLVKSVKL